MKKFLLLATLLGSTSFVSMATTASHNATVLRKPNYLVHFVGCGVDTYCYGATWAEALETAQVVNDAYC